ncbi:MAG TPA: glutamate-1-semialdehyde 2,1-aminomutase [Armatimonadota bacterium]|nr:glutamate-1-semialdehyde 2,1-aminomutase [Armatimonadota bacterium]
MHTQDCPSSFVHSNTIMSAARKWIPGGVNSPVRAYTAVGGEPVVIDRGKGSHLWDVDGNKYIDFVCSWGPLILGHAPDVVVAAIQTAAEHGTSFGMPTALEAEFASLICQAMPAVEMIRLVNSGTEAVMSAIRLARAVTGRNIVVKFDGGYHGHSDGLLVKAGSGITTLSIPGTPGVPDKFASLTISIPFNNLDALCQVLEIHGREVACLIGEPVPANMGVILPQPGYWQEVRRLLDDYGILLIFDEVITGFRLDWEGHAYTEVTPDLVTLGKIIGGGLPVGAYGGRADLLQHVAPSGPVYQAGTLSGNPLAVSAGLATLQTLSTLQPYHSLNTQTERLVQGIAEIAAASGVSVHINRAGSMFTIFFTDQLVTDFTSACSSETKHYAAFFHACLKKGVMLPPSQFEATFLSTAHTEVDIERTLTVMTSAFHEVS